MILVWELLTWMSCAPAGGSPRYFSVSCRCSSRRWYASWAKYEGRVSAFLTSFQRVFPGWSEAEDLSGLLRAGDGAWSRPCPRPRPGEGIILSGALLAMFVCTRGDGEAVGRFLGVKGIVDGEGDTGPLWLKTQRSPYEQEPCLCQFRHGFEADQSVGGFHDGRAACGVFTPLSLPSTGQGGCGGDGDGDDPAAIVARMPRYGRVAMMIEQENQQ